MTYDEIIKKVAADNGMSANFVNRVYRAYWSAIRKHITSLPLKEDLTDEEFFKLRPSVNIPSIGKLNVTLERYKRLKTKYKQDLERITSNVAHTETKTQKQ